VARDYARRRVTVDAARVVLTASTSEAYSFLFKLLCDPGQSDALTPAPSYPLFDHLTRLDGVRQRTYRLTYHGHWCTDPAGLDDAWTSATRAALVVSPNNPTGSAIREDEARELSGRCASRGAALILDEVFCDYPFEHPWPNPATLTDPACLVFRLGGLSKTVGFPQIKLGCIVVHPGFFFDFPHEAFVIVSLLPEPHEFARGVARVLERVDAA